MQAPTISNPPFKETPLFKPFCRGGCDAVGGVFQITLHLILSVSCVFFTTSDGLSPWASVLSMISPPAISHLLAFCGDRRNTYLYTTLIYKPTLEPRTRKKVTKMSLFLWHPLITNPHLQATLRPKYRHPFIWNRSHINESIYIFERIRGRERKWVFFLFVWWNVILRVLYVFLGYSYCY